MELNLGMTVVKHYCHRNDGIDHPQIFKLVLSLGKNNANLTANSIRLVKEQLSVQTVMITQQWNSFCHWKKLSRSWNGEESPGMTVVKHHCHWNDGIDHPQTLSSERSWSRINKVQVVMFNDIWRLADPRALKKNPSDQFVVMKRRSSLSSCHCKTQCFCREV